MLPNLIVLSIYIFVIVAILVLGQRIGIYSLYAPMTERPWTRWERFCFKWWPWFPWSKLENAYLSSPGRSTVPGIPRYLWGDF